MKHSWLLFVLLSSCVSSMSHEELVQALSSSSPFTRREAADQMRHQRSFGHDGVPALVEAAENEGNVEALGAELIALGASGSPDAAPLVCKYLRSTNPDLQRWASKAFYLWLPQNPNRPMCPDAAGN